MKNSFRMHLTLFVLLIISISCKKAAELLEPITPVPVEQPKPTPPKDSIAAPSKILNIGTGSGNLSIDGKTLNISSATLIKIKGGSYKDIQISNISNKNFTVTIQNDGLIQLLGNTQIRLSNLKNVILDGKGTAGIEKGFVFKNRTADGASVLLKDNIDDFTLKNFSFSNLTTYGVIQYDSRKNYDGSETSYSNNLKFLNIDCDNTGTLIRFKGSAQNNLVTGLVRNVEIANVIYKNSRAVGSVVVIENADSFNIHNNLVQNVNQDNSNHNGIFYLQGNGKFYNNLVRDHQGNAIRAWAYSIGTTPKQVLIFNNIIVSSREYSAFELQSFQRNIIPGKTTYVNAKVFNNTCGNLLPKSGSFPAQVLDMYSLLGGKCEVTNNLAYKLVLVGNNNKNYFWNELENTKPTGSGNKYFKTYQDAGITDETSFNLNNNSKAKHLGVSLSIQNFDALISKEVNLDYYGKARNPLTPSVGAVE
ncbi:hypothetical protein [Pedobacter sp. V48]|uniref:hypothetical protein n=1 Tax=Pedobacter sp. V48 TaxID=509635 RepID=UPI0003E53DAB|nr:hypothetical protein [Pedobacter sp. V48]ETZ22611.1 hypothetical protein N824_22315 [Pedobacter sp. V48]